ncbi:MAG: DinB family protein [Spirochaetes bacterium]|nr:DinB family protein [Spirochaetota bacterium]
MLSQVIKASIANLRECEQLIDKISDETYKNKSVAPYYSSFGQHLRHVLDIYDCALSGIVSKIVDFSARKRDLTVEDEKDAGKAYIQQIISKLNQLSDKDPGERIMIKDDLGNGYAELPGTIGSVLVQAFSHTIHHYACVGYILAGQGQDIPHPRFGLNPTSPDTSK